MIEEEAGFLAAHDIGLEQEPGLAKNRGAGECGSEEDRAIAGCGRGLRCGLDIAAEAEDQVLRLQGIAEKAGKEWQVRQPGGGIELEHEDIGIAIQDETGPAVALPMDPAVAIGAIVEQRTSPAQRGLEVAVPPRIVEVGGFARVEDAESDG